MLLPVADLGYDSNFSNLTGKSSSDSVPVTGNCKPVTDDSAIVTEDCKQVTADCAIVTEDCKPVVTGDSDVVTLNAVTVGFQASDWEFEICYQGIVSV